MNTTYRRLIAVASLLTLAACDSDNSEMTASMAQLQVVHAVANAPSVDVSDSSSTIVSGLEFKEATGFAPVPPGALAVQVDANLPGGQATVIPATNLDLVADMAYSVIAIGEFGSMTSPIAPLVISNPSTPVGAGNARVEVVHAAPNAPAVDIHVTGPSDPIVPADALAGGSTSFGANTGQVVVPAGDYRIRVTLPGSTTPVFDSGTVTLSAGVDLLVLAIENTVAGHSAPGAPPITLLVSDGRSASEILDEATPAEVRIVHAVPDAPPVDVYLDDPMAMNAPAITGLGYTDVVPSPVPSAADPYAAIEPGTTNVLVTVSGNPGAIAIPATDLDLAAGRQYTVYATGTLATIAPFVRVDDSRSVGTEARVRILHLAPSAGLVDVYVTPVGADIANEAPALQDIDFKDDTGYLSLAGGSYDVTVTLADTKTVAIGPATVTFSDGGVYTTVARDPDPNVVNDTFGLLLLDDF